MSTWVIVVAAGSGSRFGGGKQFESLRGRRCIDWSVDTARRSADGVVVVVPPELVAAEDSALEVDAVVAGGASRSSSVRAGLAAVPDDADVILVHDAARPLASPGLYSAVLRAVLNGADAVVPGVPVVDTIKRVQHQPSVTDVALVVETVDRSELVAVQTPQGFRADALRRAHQAAPDATDDAGVVEAMGGKVVVVPGETLNIKVTVPQDLAMLEALAPR